MNPTILFLLLLFTLHASSHPSKPPVPALKVKTGECKCATLSSSPTVANILKASRQIHNLAASSCKVLAKDGTGDHCTKLVKTGDALVEICGKTGEGVSCVRAAQIVKVVAEGCEKNGRAAGTVTLGDEAPARIVVRAERG